MSLASPPSSHQSLTSDSTYAIATIFNSNFAIVTIFVLFVIAILNASMRRYWIRHLFFNEEEREVFDSINVAANFSECSIFLEEFAAGNELRVLPKCGHRFHVKCIDSWLREHRSCPNCRQTLVVAL